MAIWGFSQLEAILEEETPEVKGCFVDSSVLFAASYDFDLHHESTEPVFDFLARERIPVYTNVVVKHEFLELHRRVTIPEALSDFFTDYQAYLTENLFNSLKAHQNTHRNKIKQGRSARFNVDQIREKRELLENFKIEDKTGWQILGEDYVRDRLAPIWDRFVSEFNLIELHVREGDNSPFLNATPSWKRVYELMGKHLISSSDSLILNMFLFSKISYLITADVELAKCCDRESGGAKTIFLPDSLL